MSNHAWKSRYRSIFARDFAKDNKKKWLEYNEKLKTRLCVAFDVLSMHSSQFYLENFFA